jgi:hypothetical protein
MDIPFKPFTIVAIGPFAPAPRDARARMVPVDTPNEALSLLCPALWVSVPKEICPEGGVTISPERLKDLSPDGMLSTAPYVRDLNDARSFIRKSASGGMSPFQMADEVRSRWPGIPVELTVPEQAPKARGQNRVDDILSMVATGAAPAASEPARQEGPAAWAAAIDADLAALMRAIFSDENFRTFEEAWRGIEFLARQGPAGAAKDTRLSLVSASRENLVEALDALAADLATDPPELVLIDMVFDSSPASMELLEAVSAFAESVLAPTVVCASAGFLGLNDWGELERLAYLAHHIEDNPVWAKWNTLRSLPQANWLVAACNGFLARPRYAGECAPRDVLFEESLPLWISPVWAIGTLAAQSTARAGWPTRLTDGDAARLDGLALHPSREGAPASTQAVFSVDRLRQFGEIGLCPVAGVAMKDIAFVPAARTASGEPLAFQLFFSRLTGFLIRLREEHGSSLPDDAAPWLEEALETFFRLSGGHVPGDLSVRELQGERPSFAIAFTPPAPVISGGKGMAFTFAW